MRHVSARRPQDGCERAKGGERIKETEIPNIPKVAESKPAGNATTRGFFAAEACRNVTFLTIKYLRTFDHLQYAITTSRKPKNTKNYKNNHKLLLYTLNHPVYIRFP